MRPCRHAEPIAGCPACAWRLQLGEKARAYRALWDEPEQVTNPMSAPAALPFTPRPGLPCIYLGDVIDRLDCPCPGKWVRKRALHELCTLEGCKKCAEYHEQ